VSSIFPVICCEGIEESTAFYTDLLGLEVTFESGWYTLLRAPEHAQVQLGLVLREHPSVPEAFRRPPHGVIVTVEVPDVDVIHARARAARRPFVQELRDEEFGQRHFMVADPDGALVDVVMSIPLSPTFAREVAAFRRRRRTPRISAHQELEP
jgi:catechol 2,3-dioxygenase-like lactoylglutathione lyase family enzyme